MTARLTAAAILAALLLLVPAGAAAAQEAEEATSLAGAQVQVTLGDGEPDSVEVTYRLTAPAADGDTVTHQVMPRPGATIQDLSAGAGATGATLTENGVEATLEAGADAYTLSYQVVRDEGVYAVPLPHPDLPTARDAQVEIDTLLPPGQQLTGEFLPSITSRAEQDDQVELRHRGGALPSVVLAQYGGGGARLTISDWVTGLMVLAFVAVVAGWWLRERRETRTAAREVPA